MLHWLHSVFHNQVHHNTDGELLDFLALLLGDN
jgi:hypothetical protein